MTKMDGKGPWGGVKYIVIRDVLNGCFLDSSSCKVLMKHGAHNDRSVDYGFCT